MSQDQLQNLVRHTILSTILSYNKKHKQNYGPPVLCCDGKDYWRKDVFPNYKSVRKVARDKSDLDWKMIFDTISMIKAELIENFPYKVIHHNRAEGDDIIAILTEWNQENNIVQVGLYEEPEPTLIVSSDHDFKQLFKYQNIRQWSPIQHKFVTAKADGKALIEHIVRGDSGDGVPNILSPDNSFTDGIRQKSITQKIVDHFILSGGEAGCSNELEKTNWKRNQSMVDFAAIPDWLKEDIINQYINTTVKKDSMKIFNYLMKNRCQLLMNDIQDF